MRLKQAAREVTSKVTREAALEATTHRYQASQEQHEDVNYRQQASKQSKSQQKTIALPTAKSFLKSAALGLLVSVLCFLLLYVLVEAVKSGAQWNRSTHRYWGGWADGIVTSPSATLVYILLPTLIAFRLGWKQRDGVKGAALCLVLAMTFALGFTACMTLAGRLDYSYFYFLPLSRGGHTAGNQVVWFSICNLLPTALTLIIAPLLLAAGAIGGACSKVVEAVTARSRKNNR